MLISNRSSSDGVVCVNKIVLLSASAVVTFHRLDLISTQPPSFKVAEHSFPWYLLLDAQNWHGARLTKKECILVLLVEL